MYYKKHERTGTTSIFYYYRIIEIVWQLVNTHRIWHIKILLPVAKCICIRFFLVQDHLKNALWVLKYNVKEGTKWKKLNLFPLEAALTYRYYISYMLIVEGDIYLWIIHPYIFTFVYPYNKKNFTITSLLRFESTQTIIKKYKIL